METPQPIESEVSVFVNPQKQYQSFIGIGGAITDASAEVFSKLSADKQQELLNAYYDKEKGIGYTLIRTNIHSCDFSSGSYTYVNEGDKVNHLVFSTINNSVFHLLKKLLRQQVEVCCFMQALEPTGIYER